jgi:L-lactate dehydrogenase complex protein LldF
MTTAREQFGSDSATLTTNSEHRFWMQAALRGYEQTRGRAKALYRDYDAARSCATSIKWEAIENLPSLLARFTEKLESRGTKICWAATGAEARDYILRVARERGAKSIVKSKCMTTEEIHLNEALADEGFDVIESDLGEYIVQLREEPPFHFVFPAMHLRREEISRVFEDKLGTPASRSPEELTATARKVLRDKFCRADIGITGANFGVAETGMISITENEGNARLTAALPKVHIAVMGIEKVIPRLRDLAVLLPLLAVNGTGQELTCYNSLVGGPRQEGESDGPEEFHVVLLDNHRTGLLADPVARDALRCIRCGACLNVCPVFKNIGGHAYGTTYQGPIGSVITPHLRGLREWGHLSEASSLCGACTEICPVGIDLHHLLLRNRAQAVSAGASAGKRMAMKLFAAVMRRPALYRIAGAAMDTLLRMRSVRTTGGRFNPLRKWTATRDLPAPPAETFKDYWRSRRSRSQRDS